MAGWLHGFVVSVRPAGCYEVPVMSGTCALFQVPRVHTVAPFFLTLCQQILPGPAMPHILWLPHVTT